MKDAAFYFISSVHFIRYICLVPLELPLYWEQFELITVWIQEEIFVCDDKASVNTLIF